MVELDDLSFQAPQSFIKIEQQVFEGLKQGLKKVAIEQGEQKYFEAELEMGFITQAQSSLLVYSISDKITFERLYEDYLNYLKNLSNVKQVERTKMTVNNHRVIQFQIIRESSTSLKLFFSTDNRVVCLEFVMNNNEYYTSLRAIESSISSIKSKLNPIILETSK